MENPKLARCPFCGSQPITVRFLHTFITCRNDECGVMPCAMADCMDEAVAKWNRRTPEEN